MKRVRRLLVHATPMVVVLLALAPGAATAGSLTRWHWEQDFSEEERTGLSAWIMHSTAAMDALFGPLSARFDVHFYRLEGRGEPVPWGETNKGGGRHVHFYVDPSYAWADFRADWTAPHELTHLLFPYLGEDSRWFAEGVASYLQYPLLFADGQMTWTQVIASYRARFASARASATGSQSVVERSRGDLQGRYLPIYWGGAAFFLAADRALFEQRGLRLTDIVARYSACCYRPWGVEAADLIAQFDRLSDSRVFSQAYAATVAAPGFPATDEALSWLSRHPPTLHRPET